MTIWKLTTIAAIIWGVILATSLAQAAPPDEGQEYVVQADDWLSKLADKFFGNPLAYPRIVEATNTKAAADASFATITNPDRIEVGQKLFIPANAPSLAAQPAADSPPAPPSPAQQQLLASLAVKGAPPELHNDTWLNSEPLKLADLRGKVVIVEFWTYG